MSASLLEETVRAPWGPPEDTESTLTLRESLRAIARRVAETKLGVPAAAPDAIDAYASRLWRAVQVHFAKREVEPRSTADVEAMLNRIENGELHYGRVRENVVADVVVAMGLERRENEAATVFQNDYMPIVRYHANRFAGQRGVDAVENLAADLVLPRGERPPKIATYRGLTPLKAWLRSVVANACVGAHRAQREVALDDTVHPVSDDTVQITAAEVDCEKKLAPAFRDSVDRLPTADRVLLKMLILDGVPQKQLAKSFGVDSGTLTRRRQKAATALMDEIRRLATSTASGRPITDCLEVLLAGDAKDLRSRLATILAAPFRDGNGSSGEVSS